MSKKRQRDESVFISLKHTVSAANPPFIPLDIIKHDVKIPLFMTRLIKNRKLCPAVVVPVIADDDDKSKRRPTVRRFQQ